MFYTPKASGLTSLFKLALFLPIALFFLRKLKLYYVREGVAKALLVWAMSAGLSTSAWALTTSAVKDLTCAGFRSGSMGCTAGEFTVAPTFSAAEGTPPFCVAGSDFNFKVELGLAGTNADRMDVGFFVGQQGNDPRLTTPGNICSVATFPKTPLPWKDNDGDACGDFQAAGVQTTIIDEIKVKCAGNTSGDLTMPYVLTYWQNNGNVCTGPGNVSNGAPSKCNADTGLINGTYPVKVGAYVDVTKATLPAGNTTDIFTFTATGPAGSKVGALVDGTYNPATGEIIGGTYRPDNTTKPAIDGGGTPTNTVEVKVKGGQTVRFFINATSTAQALTITETATPAGWDSKAGAISCSSPAITTDLANRSIVAPMSLANSTARCTFTNNKTPTITLNKALAGDRMAVSDQFSVAIRTGGVSGTVVSSTTNATTTGTMAAVTAGTGTTGSYSAAVGTAYTLTEAAAGGASLANYSATLSCVDTSGVQTGLPSGVAFNPAVGYTITPVAGAALSCTITNAPILVPPSTQPSISCSSDGNIFNTAYNGNPAGPAKTSGLDNVWERGATFGALEPTSWTLANVVTTNPGWSAYSAFPASRFVAHQATPGHIPLGNVDLWYRYVFTMDPSVVLSRFRLAMDFYADNSVQAIYVNGVPQSVTGVPDGNPYSSLHFNLGTALSANLTNNWQAGTNTILVRVSSGPGSIGFMAKNTVSTVCQTNVSLQKALGGLGRLAVADQFTVDIRTGGVSGTVVNSTTNSTTLGSGANVTAGSGNTGVYLATPGTAYTLNEAMASGSTSALTSYTTRTLSCTNVGGTTNVSGFSSLPLTFSPVSGDNVLCTVTNTPPGNAITGRVFLDNGVLGGTANDGLINGGEAGLAGITVRLTNCAATVHASGVTDGTGAYNLSVLTGTVTGAALCVEQTNQGTRVSTGASVGSTALPSGAATSVASTTYTYTRTSTPDRIAFTWNGTGHSDLNFGDVDTGTFTSNGSKSGPPNTTVSYTHIFTAGTGGSVSFAVSAANSAPTLAGWSEKIFSDPGCTGTLQAGAAQLYPPAAAGTSVVFGQKVCLIMQEFIPSTAQMSYSNDATVQASFTYSNANPSLPTASYTLHDITTVSNGTLELKKEVRNVTQGVLTFGITNQAKSGETLEYRISYTNNASTPISNLIVNDATPVYTTFVGSSTGTTPATLTACTKNTPFNPLPAPAVSCATAQAAGNTGSVSWMFTGSLSPGDTGEVLFQVKVD